jgi:uncharacterized membrane protein YkvA (DUF1232 family)
MSRLVKETVILGLLVVSVLYLGFPYLIPDFIPWIGQLDDGVAFTIILGALRHYGLDLTEFFGKREKQKMLPEDRTVQQR